MEIKERFLNYVSFDTQSDSYSHTVPSTSKQLKLGNYLVEELKSLGIENAKIDEFGVVYGTIPSNNNHQGDVIGFIAHMDTSPDASGKDIHPQIIKDYQGQKITLNEDKELVDSIRKKLKENNYFCPCRLVKNEDTKCMCKEFREQTEGECHCGLYVKVK